MRHVAALDWLNCIVNKKVVCYIIYLWCLLVQWCVPPEKLLLVSSSSGWVVGVRGGGCEGSGVLGLTAGFRLAAVCPVQKYAVYACSGSARSRPY